MSSEKKENGNKTFSHHLHASKDASTSLLGDVMITECVRTTGIGECHPFLRKNAHLGPIPWTVSLWRARPRRGNPQHFVRQHRGMVKQLWQGILLADTKAHRTNAKIAKINSEHRTNLMLKCPSAHLHTTSYLARFLAKTRNRFKRATLRAYATAKAATPADFGVKCSVLLLHPCISEDGLILAPNYETMRATHVLRNDASEHIDNHQTHQKTNKSSADAGPNSHALALKTSSSNLPAMADGKKTMASTQCLQGMPAGPHEDPPTDTQETLPQRATQRSNAVAFLGNWKRGHALKMLIAAVLRNKAHNNRHTAFEKWIQYTKTKINTADLAACTIHTSLAEAFRKWQCLRTINNERRNTKNTARALHARLNTQNKTMVFNNWWQHAQDSSAARRPHVQLFLRGVADGILTITVPVPVTRKQLHEVIAKKTLVPPQEQSLGSMYQYAHAQNADLFYMKKNNTLDLSLLLNGGSGSSRAAKQAKPLTHQPRKFFIYVNGPDQHQNTVKVLPSDKIRRVKELLEDRVDLQPCYQTIFLYSDQLDDNLTLQDCDIIEGTTLQLLRANPPKSCEEHDKPRNPEHLRQKLDPNSKQWIWVCCPGSICRMQGPSQKSAGAATNAPNQHPVPPQAKRTPQHVQEGTEAAETISGGHHQTPLLDTQTSFNIGTRVYARFTDGQEYAATILGRYRGGYFVAYDEEPEVSYRVKNDCIRPWHLPLTHLPPEPSPSDQIRCGLHHRFRSISNLKWQAHPISNIFQMICKPTQECSPRPTHHKDIEQQDQYIRPGSLTPQHNPETDAEDTSSTSSRDEITRNRLSVSAKATFNAKKQQRGTTSIETKASTVLRTAPPKLAHTIPTSAPAQIPRVRVRQVAPLNNDDLSAGMDERRAHPQQQGPFDEHLSLRKLKQTDNSFNSAASNATNNEGTQQPPSLSQDLDTPLPELNDLVEALGQLASLNLTGNDATSQLTPNQEPPAPLLPQATAPNLPLPPTAALYIEFFVHGAGYSLDFRRSPDLRIGRLKQEISHKTSKLGTQIPAAELTLSFKGTTMEDTAALREYNLQQNALNIIDLSVSMRAAATPSNAPHTPLPPEAPPPADVTPDLPSSITTEDHTSPSEDAASRSELEQTNTKITFGGRTLDEYSSALLQPELSEGTTALTQLAAIAPQRAPKSQRQVMEAPTDQLLYAPPQPTPTQIKLDEDAGQEEPDELTPPPTGMGEPLTEARLSASPAHKLLPQAAPIDVPIKPVTEMIQFFVATLDGSSITMFDSLDTTGGQLKARLETKTGIPAAQQILSYTTEIQDLVTLREISLPAKGTIHMSLLLPGGMKTAADRPTPPIGTLCTEDAPENAAPILPPKPIPRAPTPTRPQKTDTEMIQFFVQTLNGSSLTMRALRDTTGGQLKARLQIRTGIPFDQQRLTYINDIQDLATLREISLQENSTIRISLRLFGGMEQANTTERLTHTNVIYVRSLGISVTHTPQGYEITSIDPNSPAGKDKRISQGQLIKKIDDSFGNLRDIDSVGRALQGTLLTPVTLHLKSPLTPVAFPVILMRQQNHPLGSTSETPPRAPETRLVLPATSTRPLSEESRGSPDRDPSPSESALGDRDFAFLEDTSPPPGNLTAGHGPPSPAHEEPQTPSQDHTDTLAVLRSMNTLLDGKPKGSYVSQKELAGLTYAAIPGTVEDIKRRLMKKYGDRGAFTHFLKARTHPTGQPLLEWKDGTPTELRLAAPSSSTSAPPTKTAQTAPYAAGPRPAAAATCPPPRPKDLRTFLRTAPKKPRLSEHTQDEQMHRGKPPTPAKQPSTARLQQAMIEVCHNPRAPHINTFAALRKELELYLEVPDNTLEERKGDIEKWLQLLKDLHITIRTVQALNQLPPQSLLEHTMNLECGALNPWQEAITKWTHSSKSTQKAPATQPLPNAHQHDPSKADGTFTWQGQKFREGDFLHISYNPPTKRSSTQLGRLLQVVTPERLSKSRAAKPPSIPQLKIQEWTTIEGKNPRSGGYIDDKSKILKLSLQNTDTLRLQASLPRGPNLLLGFPADPFFNHVAQSPYWDPSLSYVEMAICRRVSKTWNTNILQGLQLSRALSLYPRNKIRGPDWHPKATDADFERAVRQSNPQTKAFDLTGQNLLSAASIHTLFDNFPGLEVVHLSEPDLVLTAVALKVRNLPKFKGLHPPQFIHDLSEVLNEGELALYPSPLADPHATAGSQAQPGIAGPASPLHFMTFIWKSPGCTLEVDPLYISSAEATLRAAAKNDWHTLALRQLVTFGDDAERTFGIPTLVKDQLGNTPLLLACQHGHYEAAEVLLLNPRISPSVSLASVNHLGDSPLLAACQAGNDKLVTLIRRSAEDTWEPLIRKVRLDGHTLLTASIQSKNAYLLHLALAQPFFSLLRPELLLAAKTFSDKLRALATAASSPDQIEHWIRGAEELLPPRVTATALTGTWVTYPHLIAKNTVFRLLATITANPNTPTPLKSAIGNILGMLTQNRSLLTACPAKAWAPAIQSLLSQLAAQADCPGLSQQTPHLDQDKFLPTRTITPTAASKRQCPAKDVLVFTTTTVNLALSQDATTLARQEHNHFTVTDIATGATIGKTMNLSQAWHTQLTCLAMQWEEADALSLLWADASGGIHRWIPKSGKIESDNTNARGTHKKISKIAFTLDAKAVVILSHDGCVHIAHLSPTKLSPWSFTIAQTRSILPLSRATIITMALSPTLVAVADHAGLRIWEGAHRGCPKNAFSCLYQLNLDSQSPTTTLTFSKSGSHLAAGNTAAEAFIWNADTGKLTHKIVTGHSALGKPTSICSLAFDGDEYLTSAGKQDSQAHIWHLQEQLNKCSTPLQVEPSKWESEGELPPVITHVVSAGHLVLTASNDQAITIWKILPTPPKPIEHPEAIQAVAISPSHADPHSEYGATATAAGTKVKIWDYRDTLRTCINLPDAVRALTYSASGQRLIIASDAPDISVWAPIGLEGEFLYTLKVTFPHLAPVHTPASPPVRYTALAASDNDKRIAAGTSWGQVILWNTAHARHTPGHITTPHLYPVSSIEFTDKGATISRSTDNFLHILRTAESTDQHPIALVRQTAHGHMDTLRQKYITTLRRGILHIYHDGPFLHVVLPSHPIAFLRAPANITTVACSDTRILVGCADGSITHAFAPFLSAPQANGTPIMHLISIDLQALIAAGKTTAHNFTLQVPLYLTALELKTIVAARASIPTADVHLSYRQHPDSLPLARMEPETDPLYSFRLAKIPILRATPHPLTEEQIQASAQPTPPTGHKRVHIFPPFDLNRNHPNEDKDWTFHVDLAPTSTCPELFQRIAELTKIPKHGFYLRVKGMRVPQILYEDDNALFADLSSGDAIHVLLRLFAGNEDHLTIAQSGNPHGQIFVKTHMGKTITIPLVPSTTTADAKREIEAKQGTPDIQQRLIFAGKQMKDQDKLSRYGVSDGSTIHQLLRLRGGAGNANAYQLLLKHNKQREALLREAAREEEEGRDTAGFQKADEQQQRIQQEQQAKRLEEEQQARDKEEAQVLLNAQLKTLLIEQDQANACPLADTPEKALAATNTAIKIYKSYTGRNLGTQAANRLLLHLRAKSQEGRKIRANTPSAPPNRADRVQFLLAEPILPPTPHTHPTTVEHVQASCSFFTTKLSVIEVADPTGRHAPQLFKITCDGTLTESISFLDAGFITVNAAGTARFFLIEKQHDPASQLVIRPALESSENWTMILASLIGMEASPEQFQDAILAMIHASNPTQPLPLEVRLEQSKRIGAGWHRATVGDVLGKNKKNTNTANAGAKAHPPYTPKITLVYPSPEAAAAVLDTAATIHIGITNTFEESRAATSTNEHTLKVKLLLRSNDFQPRQAEGIEGATDALISLALQHNARLLMIVHTHIPKIVNDAHLTRISGATALTELGHQFTDIANINPTLGPHASALEAELRAMTAPVDLAAWQDDSHTLKTLHLLHEMQPNLATLAPMPKLAAYNTTDYPSNVNKKRAKILEVLSRKAKETGLNFASLAWVIPPRREEPTQILVTMDDATAAAIRSLAPAHKLGTLLAALTSSTTNPPLQLQILRRKLQTTASASYAPAPTGPLSAHPPEVQLGAVALYNAMLKGDLIWVHTTDADGNPVHITNKQHTPRDKLQPADGPLYIANMCIDQEPLQALAAITAATASASGSIYKITSIAISSQIRVYSLHQILAILTTNFRDHLADALLPAASMNTDQSEAFIAEFFGKSTATPINDRLNTHYMRQAMHVASTRGLWLASPAMANQQGPPPPHLPAQDREAARRWHDNPPQPEPTIRTPLSGHLAESSRPEVGIDLEDHTITYAILAQLIAAGTLHASHKDGASLLTPGSSDLLIAMERTPLQAGSDVPWASLEVTEAEAASAADLGFKILRDRDTPVHIRTSALQDIDEFTMAEQNGPHSLTIHANSDILTKGEWGKKRMYELIVEACRARTNTGHHTQLADSTGYLLLLTSPTWDNAPVTMPVMYGPNWQRIAAAAAADRGTADHTLKQAKLFAAQRVLLDECRKTPIHVVSASIENGAIQLTGPARTTDPSTDPSSLAFSGRQQHPYNSTATGTESTTALEALSDLLRQQLLVAVPHQGGLLFTPHIPERRPDPNPAAPNPPTDPDHNMRDAGETAHHPEGEAGAAAKQPT